LPFAAVLGLGVDIPAIGDKMAHGRKHGFGDFVGSESGVRSKNQDYRITIGSER